MKTRVVPVLAGLIVAALTVVVVSACSLTGSGFLVGSTNFTESRILANIFALSLSRTGTPAQVKELTAREILEPALAKGQLQAVPEYLGTFTEFLNKKQNGTDAPALASSDPATTYQHLVGLAEPLGLTVLPPSPAQDQNAFAVTGDYAKAHNLTTLSQLGTFSKSHSVTLGAGPECPTRPFCQPGLEQTYGITFAGFMALDSGGPLTVQALQQDKIQLGLMFSSSGMVAAYNLTLLADDKHLQTADNVIPVLHTGSQTPQITATLNKVSAKLTTEDLQQLNAEVDLQRKDPRDVASQWLDSIGITEK